MYLKKIIIKKIKIKIKTYIYTTYIAYLRYRCLNAFAFSSSPGFGHTLGLAPGLGLAPDLHSKALPKLVATKMLAATSVHPKMKLELGKIRCVKIVSSSRRRHTHNS